MSLKPEPMEEGAADVAAARAMHTRENTEVVHLSDWEPETWEEADQEWWTFLAKAALDAISYPALLAELTRLQEEVDGLENMQVELRGHYGSVVKQRDVLRAELTRQAAVVEAARQARGWLKPAGEHSRIWPPNHERADWVLRDALAALDTP